MKTSNWSLLVALNVALVATLLAVTWGALARAAPAPNPLDEPVVLTKGQLARLVCALAQEPRRGWSFRYDAATNTLKAFGAPRTIEEDGKPISADGLAHQRARAESRLAALLPLFQEVVNPAARTQVDY